VCVSGSEHCLKSALVCVWPWVMEQRKAMDAKKEAWEEARKHKDDEARFKASQADKKRAESAAKAADAAKRKADAAAAPKVGPYSLTLNPKP